MGRAAGSVSADPALTRPGSGLDDLELGFVADDDQRPSAAELFLEPDPLDPALELPTSGSLDDA